MIKLYTQSKRKSRCINVNIQKKGDLSVVMSNPYGKANYFGWPSVARLQNGKIAVVASGYRYAHVCPFGKGVISYSEDEGESYTIPAPVIDTPLDDRDAGILATGETDVIVTSFNNQVAFQRKHAGGFLPDPSKGRVLHPFFDKALDLVEPEEEERYIGATFRISHDGGITFGELHKSPVTSPHGPCTLRDGSILWVGRTFSKDNFTMAHDEIQAYRMHLDGSMQYLGSIPNIPFEKGEERPLSCEPHAIELDDGRILCHIRVQREGLFTLFQSESGDKGRTWSTPRQILGDNGGAPAHLLRHSSGVLICTYGYRQMPYGIKAMFSCDMGRTWSRGQDIYTDSISWDLGYPCSIELKDSSILTVFYAHEQEKGPAVIMQQKWSF